jgi:hypothetical protein
MREAVELSILLPFGDDEEIIGSAVRRCAMAARSLGIRFELLGIDEDSGDNSHAVLALLRSEVPELRVIHAPGRHRGVESGAARAQGRLLLITTPTGSLSPLEGLAEAIARVSSEACDAEIAVGRYTIVNRLKALPTLRAVRLPGASVHRRLAKRFQLSGLAVRMGGASLPMQDRPRGLRAFARVFRAAPTGQ